MITHWGTFDQADCSGTALLALRAVRGGGGVVTSSALLFAKKVIHRLLPEGAVAYFSEPAFLKEMRSARAMVGHGGPERRLQNRANSVRR